ncbi:MAG: acyl-CoA dehydrogenase family protein [Candidatus Dormibacteraeota bacterium]|nr:acyl-CoA dehydrogenase family protein [Candidatus Dormibacteraeota bacterium]
MDAGSDHTDHDPVRREVEGWLEESWDPDLTVRDWWARLAASGWGFPSWPRAWFGRGLGPEVQGTVRDVFLARGALGPPASLGQLLGGPVLLTHGSAALRERFLPLLARGEEAWCQFFSEPGAGSDLAGLQTRAERDGDGWVVHGQKVWTSGAQFADRGMLVARTDPDVPKHQGLTYFIIDLDQPGVEIRPLHQMNGGEGFNEVFFSGARVEADRVVGEVGGGWAVAVTTLMFERFMSALPSAAPGVRGGMLEVRAGDVASGKVAGERESMGQARLAPRVIDVARSLEREADPLVRQRLAELVAKEEVSRLMGLRSAAAVSAGRRPGAEGSVRKIARSDISRTASAVGMETLGAHGLVVGEDTPGGGRLQQQTLSSPGISIAGGTDEIQRNIIGERVLGLPKEPRLDVDVPFRRLRVGTQREEG